MLIDNKFIALSLPRCASTSLYITCLRNNISVEHYDESFYKTWSGNIDMNLSNEELADIIVHGHDKITDLYKKFGYGYDVIGIRRNRYDRFISLWKHVVDLANSANSPLLNVKLENLKLDDILFYTNDDLVSEKKREEVVNEFINRNGIRPYMNDIVKTIIYILITPISEYHNHDPNIIWFDFDKLYELEEWVSNKLGKPFKLEKSNSSNHFKSNLILNDEFITRYNDIYDYYDIKKTAFTLI
jgi:hypothetical protein